MLCTLIFIKQQSVRMIYLFKHFSKHYYIFIFFINWVFRINFRNEISKVSCLPLVPLLVGSVRRRSLWLERLNRLWMRPRRRTLSSLSEEGMERLRSSSMERSESESESPPECDQMENRRARNLRHKDISHPWMQWRWSTLIKSQIWDCDDKDGNMEKIIFLEIIWNFFY